MTETFRFGSGYTFQYVPALGPEMAATLLQANKGNRPMKRTVVNRYVESMECKQWLFTGQPIIVDSNGDLRNGQHVLTSIVESGLSQEIVIIRGVAPESFDRIDTGKGRSGADALHVAGYAKTCLLAGAVRAAIRYRYSERPLQTFAMAPHSILSWVQEHPEIIESMRLYPWFRPAIIRESVGVALLDWARAIDPAAAKEFFGRFADGDGIGRASVLYYLRRRLAQNKEKSTKAKLPLLDQTAFVIIAWNHFRKYGHVNGNSSIIRWRRIGPKQHPFPRMQ